jgi:hypothetical protein
MNTKWHTTRIALSALFAASSALFAITISPQSSYGLPTEPEYSSSLRLADREGTTHYAPSFEHPVLGAEYTGEPPVVERGDTYARDEVVLKFRREVSSEQQNALLTTNHMTFNNRIYGLDDTYMVTKVTPGSALEVADSLRENSLLEGASVNGLTESFYTPNDTLYEDQENLFEDQINASGGWDFGHGLGQVSLVGIVDSGIDYTHPDISPKYDADNWQTFCGGSPTAANTSHGTNVAGLVVAATDNYTGVASTGFSAWPMSLKVDCPTIGLGSGGSTITEETAAVNWAADHGVSVLNFSRGCIRGNTGCSPSDTTILAYKAAIDSAYDRGITIVAGVGNDGANTPAYPAAFGQYHGDDLNWAWNPQLVIAVAGSYNGWKSPESRYGEWVDVSAPYKQDDNAGLWTTGLLSTQDPYVRFTGTSASAPQVSGLASLLTTLGYSSDDVWEYIVDGATDLYCPEEYIWCEGYDTYTGYGRINMGDSMDLAHRELETTGPGMTVVPNAGHAGVQWFNAQGSGFEPFADLEICWTPPSGPGTCEDEVAADDYGVAGLGIQISGAEEPPTGTWTVTMCDLESPPNCAYSSFTVLP